MQYFRLKDFEKFQHYKDRNPPWIKLYSDQILDDYNFGRLPDSVKYQFIAISSLASRYNNKLPLDSKWVQNKIQTCSEVNFEHFLNMGFIEIFEDEQEKTGIKTEKTDIKIIENQIVNDDIGGVQILLASCYENARPETETETETDILVQKCVQESVQTKFKQKKTKTEKHLKGFEEFWTAYPRKQNRGRAEKAWQSLAPSEPLTVQILQAVEEAKTSEDWRKEGGQFIPHPSSWLNAKGWLDEGLDLKALNTSTGPPKPVVSSSSELPIPPTDEEREASLQAMREAKKSLPWADSGGGERTIEDEPSKPEKPPDERLVSAKPLAGLVHGLTGKMSMSEITTNSETTRI